MRGWIYDKVFARLTARWYTEVLARLPRGARLLDIGIGTAAPLARNADLVKAKDLQVVGVDIDPDYIATAQENLEQADLVHRVEARLESVYDHRDGPYDAAYFSCSFMLMPDPPGALRHVQDLLRPDGRVYFTQTFTTRRSPLLERVKPMLKKVTTIDFGQVTYEEDFRRALVAAELEILEMSEMSSSGSMSYRLVAGRPAAGKPSP